MKAVQVCTEGHPDKVCDQIADAIVDEYLRRDPQSRVDLSVMGSHGMLMIAGRVRSLADFDVGDFSRRVYREIGYLDEVEPFVNIEAIVEDEPIRFPATDGTVIVHGYATRETMEFLPRPLVLANTLARQLDNLRRNDQGFSWIRPDGKIQLLMDGAVIKGVTILLQHDEKVNHAQIQQLIVERLLTAVLGRLDSAFISVNPVGCFSQGGLRYDTGASNRKIADDTYGGLIPFGTAGLFGKDPGRAERAVTYMARYAAKRLVIDQGVDNCLIRVATSLGRTEPVLIEARTGHGQDLSHLARSQFDWRLEAIVERLNLRRPIYRAIAAYGQFGRPGLPWEEK